MPKWLRISLRIAGSFIILIVLCWLGLAWYINTHKQQILQAITTQLKQNLKGGELRIEDMDPALLRGFPDVAISLKNITLRDSLWANHHHDLIQAKNLFVRIGVFPLISGKVSIRRLQLQEGSIYLYTDSLEYSNTNMLRSDDTGKHGQSPVIQRFDLEDVKFIIENRPKHKFFRFDVDDLEGNIDYTAAGWDLDVNTKLKIVSMAFNTDKGSFLQNKKLSARLNLHFDKATRELQLPEQTLDIDDDPVQLKGSFSFAGKPPNFKLYINAKDILFSHASSFLSPSIAGKLKRVEIKDPINIQATLIGRMKYRDTPMVRVDYQIADNTLKTSVGTFEHCSFTGSFTNELIKGDGFNDHNSAVKVYKMKADFSGITFYADTLTVYDLKRPVLYCRLRSDFPLKQLNDLTSGETFRFDDGNASVNLIYRGLLEAGDTLQPYLRGVVKVQHAAATYVPRSLSFKNTNMLLEFSGYDLFMRDLHVQSGQSTLNMQGSAMNFLSFFWRAPDKVVLDWHIASPIINLNEFSVFLQKRAGATSGTQKTAVARNKASILAKQLNKVLDESSVRMQVNINKIIYRKFAAENLKATALLTNSGLELRDMAVNHAGGTISANGKVLQQGNGNTFSMNANIDKVNIQQLFNAFENFGQDAIVTENLRGNLTAKVNASGRMDEKTKIVPKSIKANVSFDLQEGALVHFGPFDKIGKFVFRKRNLSNVTFTRLENSIDMDGGKITINPMLIQTSAINLQVQGTYNPPQGTDISIVVPLRNPKKDDISSGVELEEKDWKKGIIVYLRATDGSDGNVKISWDPAKKGLKSKLGL